MAVLSSTNEVVGMRNCLNFLLEIIDGMYVVISGGVDVSSLPQSCI
jgi:hypothetical protein